MVKESTKKSEQIDKLIQWLSEQVIGQSVLIERMVIALISGGHILVEGPPGLAKTRAVKLLAQAIEGSFHRIQFTPDLLPSDITGTDIYQPTLAILHSKKALFFII